MSEIDSKLKEENETIKTLFNLNGDEMPLAQLKEVFINFVKRSKNDLQYFIEFLNIYSSCRPQQQMVSKEFMEYLYFCFPEQINEIQGYFKDRTSYLKFIIFPEEIRIHANKKQIQLFTLLQKDDIDGFILFLSKNPGKQFQITKKQNPQGFYFDLFEYSSISLIDFCCFFGSLNCFKYLLLNKCEITKETLKCSIAGGNQEIINILKEKGHKEFEECLETSVQYHRYELTTWLNEYLKCKPFPLPKCIKYYNIDAFLYFLYYKFLQVVFEYLLECKKGNINKNK